MKDTVLKIRVDKDLFQKLAALAIADERPLSTYARLVLKRHVEEGKT